MQLKPIKNQALCLSRAIEKQFSQACLHLATNECEQKVMITFFQLNHAGMHIGRYIPCDILVPLVPRELKAKKDEMSSVQIRPLLTLAEAGCSLWGSVGGAGWIRDQSAAGRGLRRRSGR